MSSFSSAPFCVGGSDATYVTVPKQEQETCVPPPNGVGEKESDRMSFQDYLQASGIPGLFDTLTAVLLREKPEDPVAFILSWLQDERAQAVLRGREMMHGSEDSYDNLSSSGIDVSEDDNSTAAAACLFPGTGPAL